MTPEIIEADLTWTGTAFESGVQIIIDPTGHIGEVGALGKTPTKRIRNCALLPGMVNAHSHAFQRGLRGLGEDFREGHGSFWSWRQTMYELVEHLDAATFRDICVQTFSEMRAGGITTVGEFHYLHHSPGTTDFAFDEIVLDAAVRAGVRLVLLSAFYRTGGIRRPLNTTQQRFDSGSFEEYWDQIDRLATKLHTSTQQLGVVAHSVRAVDVDDIAQLHREALARELVFHMHIEEQQKEIDECVTAYGRRPLALLNDVLTTAENFTAVHCTHSHPHDMERFIASGGTVCVCPLTEANLGDGIPDLTVVNDAEGRICLGTDSNARISITEEMRWLEYGQRLATETRGVLIDPDGSAAKRLFEIGTLHGAASLDVNAGKVTHGAWADFFTIDLLAPSLAGADEETLLSAFVFGTGNEVIAETCVGGQWS